MAVIMESEIFSEFCQLIQQESGIALGRGKEALMSARISKRMRALKIGTFDDYLDVLRADNSGAELTELLDVISTNVTSFFREPEHFDYFDEAFRSWRAAGRTRFRIWSAACSTGEEPYTLAMVAAGHLDATCDCKILATDISTRVLRNAQAGRYPERLAERVPAPRLHQFFTKEKADDGPVYCVSAEIQRLVVFKRLNLSVAPFPMNGPFDAVFCRNVMIYFDNDTRKSLLNEIHRLLRPGGLLMVGHSESFSGIANGFKSIRPSIYTK
jgi:chemotaxis protein methyltransferase CheR